MNEQRELLELLTLDDLNEKERSMAETIGMDAYRALVMEYGGADPLYIPKAESLTAPIRNRLILEEYDGVNAYELAKKYGLTEAYIRLLVKEKTQEIKRRPVDGQILLY